jgi:hypothetical protein
MDIVGKNNTMTRLRTTLRLVHLKFKNVLGFLDVVLVGPVLSIKVVICYNVAKILHNGLTGIVAGGIWRAHVCWISVKDVANSHFSFDHFVISFVVCDCTQVRMAPGVTGDLMAFRIHSAYHINPPGIRIDGAMAIVSAKEECGLEAILCQAVEDLASVDVGPVIERESDSARFLTCANTSATVRYVTQLWTWVVACAWSGLARLQRVALQGGAVSRCVSSHKRRHHRKAQDMRKTHGYYNRADRQSGEIELDER